VIIIDTCVLTDIRHRRCGNCSTPASGTARAIPEMCSRLSAAATKYKCLDKARNVRRLGN